MDYNDAEAMDYKQAAPDDEDQNEEMAGQVQDDQDEADITYSDSAEYIKNIEKECQEAVKKLNEEKVTFDNLEMHQLT